jgi:hypothetical protein
MSDVVIQVEFCNLPSDPPLDLRICASIIFVLWVIFNNMTHKTKMILAQMRKSNGGSLGRLQNSTWMTSRVSSTQTSIFSALTISPSCTFRRCGRLADIVPWDEDDTGADAQIQRRVTRKIAKFNLDDNIRHKQQISVSLCPCSCSEATALLNRPRLEPWMDWWLGG